MAKEFDDIVSVARDVCIQLEQLDLKDMDELKVVLTRLLFEMSLLADESIQTDEFELDEDIVLPEALLNIPESLVFFVVFDPAQKETVCAMTMKNALTDIYKPLKAGLMAIDADSKTKLSVFWHWNINFKFHWGRHLIDVIRYLFLVS